jgi:hypothetical protein
MPQIPLSDVFKLHVGEMKSIDDYLKVGRARQPGCTACPKGRSAKGSQRTGLCDRCATHPPAAYRAAQVLSKKGRWNFKDRQKKFKAGLSCEYVPLPPGSKELVDELWPLYRK